MTTETLLNNGTERLTAEELTMMVGDRDINVCGFWTHTKASESYVIVSVKNGSALKEWYVPYVYRRTNTSIDTKQQLAEYIKFRKPLLTSRCVDDFKRTTKRHIGKLFGAQSTVTLPIFKKLLKNCGEWVWNNELPTSNPKRRKSSNPQRRIQALKELGFTIATKMEDQNTYHMLLPFDIVKAPTYETIPTKTRKAIFAALSGLDAYRGKTVDRSALPDHKFPEIRWTTETPESNENLTEEEMRAKFQLVQESVNQAKREVCRGCFQTGVRGKFAGIDFFYEGGERWPTDIPTTGKEAEEGCVGCFWYDMTAWRVALNKFIKENKR